jgi:CRP/FNR family transcriptional regulator, cyclic AMP receptor protein
MESAELIASRHPFLEGMCKQHLRSLAEAAIRASFAEGECIFRQGEPAHRFYLIQKGRVIVTARIPTHSRAVIQILGAGDALGWSWLFEPYRWHFDAWSEEPTETIAFHAASLREQCEDDPRLGYELMKRVSRVVIDRLHATRLQLLNAYAPKEVEM